jgi:hypothetical protein
MKCITHPSTKCVFGGQDQIKGYKTVLIKAHHNAKGLDEEDNVR